MNVWYNNNKDRAKEQRKIYYQNNREHLLKYAKEYRENNLEKLKNDNKKYKEEHNEELKQYWKKYYEENKERLNQRRREYRIQNPEKEKEYNKEYVKQNYHKKLFWNAKRRSKVKAIKNDLTLEEWEKTKEVFNNQCAYCGDKSQLVYEHFIPLNDGGEYTKKNILPACKHCNSSKNTRAFKEWYPKQKFFSKEREERILNFVFS